MKKANNQGFTLIELIVVIAIIAILMLILVPTMNGFVDRAKSEANTANAKAIYTAMKAQDTAAKTGMKDEDGKEYSSIKVTDSADCQAALLDPDFYGENIIAGNCQYMKNSSGGISVTWGGSNGKLTGIYPRI